MMSIFQDFSYLHSNRGDILDVRSDWKYIHFIIHYKTIFTICQREEESFIESGHNVLVACCLVVIVNILLIKLLQNIASSREEMRRRKIRKRKEREKK